MTKQEKIVTTIPLLSYNTGLLSDLANHFDSSVFLEFNGKKKDVKSYFGVISLGIKEGCEVVVYTFGRDADEAMIAVKQMLTMK